MLKRLFLAFTICLCGLSLFAQSDTISADMVPGPSLQPQKLHFGVTVGTGLGYYSGLGATMNHFVAPNFTYNVSQRFRVQGGMMLSYTSLNTTGGGDLENGFMSPIFMRPTTQTVAYVQGEYDLNEKLTLTGRVFGGMSTFRMPGLEANTSRLGIYGAAGGFRYKVNERTSFSVEAQFIHGNNPYNPEMGNSFIPGGINNNQPGIFGRTW